jgi:hypothetical protein
MVDNPLCADVQLLVGQEGTPVYASKVILVARSPVFEALLGGNFREGQPPPSSSSSSRSSETWASSLAPVFWHRAEIRDMEPRTMRHLLHYLYTDQLHLDLFASSPSTKSAKGEMDDTTQVERDLVALYVAADRYLVGMAPDRVRRLLQKRLNCEDDYSNVLPVFDLALAVAPELAKSLCQRIIEANASLFLGNRDEDIEAQWLGLSDAAAARVVGMDLEAIDEIDLFRAIQRRYEHHFAEATDPDDDDDDDDDDEDDDDSSDDSGKDNGDETKEERRREKREAAIVEAKKKVAGLLKGINTKLMSADELDEVVEPSGLLTYAQLRAAYKKAALTHRYAVKDLSGSKNHFLAESVRDVPHPGAQRTVRWSLCVRRTNATMSDHEVLLLVKGSRLLDHLSAEGVKIKIYGDRRLVKSFCAGDKTVTVPGELSVPFTTRPDLKRVTILVRVPPTAFTKCAKQKKQK